MRIFTLYTLTTLVLIALNGCTTLHTTGVSSIEGDNIAYTRLGDGMPSVVFQSGLGDGKAVWSPVIELLGTSVAVFAYDRPGYGDSVATSRARDPCSIAAEQRQLLRSAGIKPPYILVGHSLGGLYEYVYSRLYPDDVVALILLDPTHPDHWRRMQEEAPAAATLIKGLRFTIFGTAMRQEFDYQSTCLEQFAIPSPSPSKVLLLVRSNYQLIEKGSFEAMAGRLAGEWQQLTGANEISKVENSGHYIQEDRPDVVVNSIRKFLVPTQEQPY